MAPVACEEVGVEDGLEQSARTALRTMIGAYRVSQMLAVAGRLRLADHLAAGPRAVDELARVTGTHEDSLYRMLRALARFDVFAEAPGRMFRLTPKAEWLRSDISHSLRIAAEVVGEEWHWQPWGDLLHTVTTGETAFNHIYGESTWSWFDHHPAESARFNELMDAVTVAETEAIVSAFDFSGVRTIVDVAGGRGVLLTAILRRHAHVRGVLFNRPSVIDSARAALGSFGNRMTLVAGDFFRGVPAGGDLYILKNIIHDWDDTRAADILASCHRAMRGRPSTLLIVEHVVRPSPQACLATMADVHMMVRTGGRNRTEEEWRELLTGSGLRVRAMVPTGGPDLLEATVNDDRAD